MLYTMGRWTCPAGNPNTTEKNWDRAFLSKEDFESKHGKDSFYEAVPQADGSGE